MKSGSCHYIKSCGAHSVHCCELCGTRMNALKYPWSRGLPLLGMVWKVCYMKIQEQTLLGILKRLRLQLYVQSSFGWCLVTRMFSYRFPTLDYVGTASTLWFSVLFSCSVQKRFKKFRVLMNCRSTNYEPLLSYIQYPVEAEIGCDGLDNPGKWYHYSPGTAEVLEMGCAQIFIFRSVARAV